MRNAIRWIVILASVQGLCCLGVYIFAKKNFPEMLNFAVGSVSSAAITVYTLKEELK